MGLLFSKYLSTKNKEENNEENKCNICGEKLENDSFIICKSTNNYFHYECLTNEISHLESCEECKKMHLYMTFINNLLTTDDYS